MRSTSAPAPTATPSSCPRATGRCCRSASRAPSPPCPSRSGCSSPSSSCRWRPRNPLDPSRDMPRGIIAGLLTLLRLRRPHPVAQSVGRARQFQARRLGRAAARRLSRHLRRGLAKALALVACVGLIASLPHHPVRQGPADLFAVARRLLPALPVDHPCAPQDTARRPARGLGGGARDHVRAVVRHGRRERRRRHPGHAAQHGGGGRHALLSRCRP